MSTFMEDVKDRCNAMAGYSELNQDVLPGAPRVTAQGIPKRASTQSCDSSYRIFNTGRRAPVLTFEVAILSRELRLSQQ